MSSETWRLQTRIGLVFQAPVLTHTFLGRVAQVLFVTSHPNAGFYPAPSTLWWDIGAGEPVPQSNTLNLGGAPTPRPATASTRPVVSRGCIHTGLAGSCKAHSLPGSESLQLPAPPHWVSS